MGISLESFGYITIIKSPIFYCVGTLVLGLCFFLISKMLKVKKLFPALIILQLPSLILGIIWVLKCPYVPISDSQKVMDLAALIASGGDTSAFFNYYDMLPQQRSVALFFIPFFAIFGHHTLLAVRLLNVLCVVIIGIILSLMAYELTSDNNCAVLTPVMTAMFLPLLAYSDLAYGTLPGLCLVFLGFLFAMKLVKKPSVINVLVVSIAFPLALFVYKGTLIADIAVILFLVFAFVTGLKSEGIKKNAPILIPVVILLLYILFSQSVINALFIKCSGLAVGKGVTSLSWILMGLSSKDGVNGAGSYSFVIDRLYADFGGDTAAMNAHVKKELASTISGFFSDPKTAYIFFREKQKWQWTDSLFGSLKESLSLYTDLSGREDIGPFRMFLQSSFMRYLYLFLEVYVGFIYIASLASLVMNVIKKERTNYLHVLPLLYFLGGFAFQLLAEQKSRYCMPYFMILILYSGILFISKASTD
jgi:hypothetical protein